MKANKFLILIVLIAIVIVSGCTSNQKQVEKILPDGTIVKPDGTMVYTNGTMVEPDKTIVKPDGTMIYTNGTIMYPNGTVAQASQQNTTKSTIYSGKIIAGSTTPYVRYNKADFDKARSEGNAVYLYFYANWCPICREERPNILQAFNELNYQNAVGFEVHYNDDEVTDGDKELAKSFGISYQHTTIILDSTGKEHFRSISPISKDKIIAEIQKALQV